MTEQIVRGPLEALETRHGVFDAKSAQGVDSCPQFWASEAQKRQFALLSSRQPSGRTLPRQKEAPAFFLKSRQVFFVNFLKVLDFEGGRPGTCT